MTSEYKDGGGGGGGEAFWAMQDYQDTFQQCLE